MENTNEKKKEKKEQKETETNNILILNITKKMSSQKIENSEPEKISLKDLHQKLMRENPNENPRQLLYNILEQIIDQQNDLPEIQKIIMKQFIRERYHLT